MPKKVTFATAKPVINRIMPSGKVKPIEQPVYTYKGTTVAHVKQRLFAVTKVDETTGSINLADKPVLDYTAEDIPFYERTKRLTELGCVRQTAGKGSGKAKGKAKVQDSEPQDVAAAIAAVLATSASQKDKLATIQALTAA